LLLTRSWRRLVPSRFYCSGRLLLGEVDLGDPAPVDGTALRLVDGDDLERRVAILVERRLAQRAGEVLRVGDLLANRVAGRHIAVVCLCRLSSPRESV